MTDTQKLRARLSKSWEKPDLFAFFKKHTKRPPIFVKKGTVLFNSGDPLHGIYFIETGFVKLYELSQDGKETTIYLTGPGSVLGLRAIIAKEQFAHQYTQALTDVKIYNMSHKEYFDVLSEYPEHILDLVHALIERLNHAERRVEGFIASDATNRVAGFLNDFGKRFGKKTDGIINLPIPLTHQRIAEFVGSFRETVTVALSRLEKEKLIKVERGKITILRPKELEKRTHVI